MTSTAGASGSAPLAGADQRRDQMLAAAAALIAERGFSETRIADVAKRVGASSALVVYYFGTKDKLLTEALTYSEAHFYDAADRMLAETPGLRDRLETLVRMTCDPDGEDDIPGAWGLWFDLWAQAFRHPQVAEDRIVADRRWRDTIVGVLEDGMAAGEIGTVDTAQFAITFAALLDGLCIQVALRDPDVDSDRAFAIAMDFATKALSLPPASRGRR
ncbi:MAG: TetR/AcrR family transcriptional regulator [Nocardioides sp.]|uniref:TetR/AcrR family transcriptional regulator n=1 Tax=Nocardioides sp. TaxID=35761 RepID=UPI0039E71FF1